MKKFLKFIIGLIIVLVILVLGVFFYVVIYVDDIIENTAETIVPQMTKTNFDIEKVNTEPLEGKVEIINLYLGNPEGFPEGHALKFDKIHVHVDLKSLQSDKIIINTFVINGLDVFLYKEGEDSSNLRVILENIDSYVEELKQSQELVDVEKVKSSAKDAAPDLRFQVNLFEMNDGHVQVHAEKKLALKADVTIPQAKLENLGAEGEGLSSQDLVKAIVKEVIKNVDLAVKLQRAGEEGSDEEKKTEEKSGLSGKLQKLLTPKPSK